MPRLLRYARLSLVMFCVALVLPTTACSRQHTADAAQIQAKLEEAQRLEYAREREQAFALYGELAELGCAKAQWSYALVLEGLSHYEPAKHDVKILAWLHKAAEQGYAPAQFSLGQAREMGRFGLSRFNFSEALRWYHKAAAQGHPDAMYGLYSIYYHGQRGVITPDEVEAYKWLTLAAARFPPPTEQSAYGMGLDHQARERMLAIRAQHAQFLTPEQIAEGERRAQAWEEAHNYIRRMPEYADKPLPLWFNAIEAECND
ncbi:MAG: sel1 repeat family protein [Marinobacter sp.]|nr:sel1 repeat family protein [Marinobacter sp.]